MNRRIPLNSNVCRVLFPVDDTEHEASVDNWANFMQEQMIRDKIKKTQKWGFDFQNETPLNGPYEWTQCDGSYAWIGRRKSEDEDYTVDIIDNRENETSTDEALESDTNESFLSMQIENEATPKAKSNNVRAAIMKKRRSDDKGNVGEKIKKTIIFD